MSPNVRNSRFKGTEVETRYGIQSSVGFVLPSKRPVTGLACLKVGSQVTSNIEYVTRQTLFTDIFNRADGALGANWSTWAGAISVFSNQAKRTGPDGLNEVFYVNDLPVDQWVELDWQSGGFVDLKLRGTDDSYWAFSVNALNDYWYINDNQGGQLIDSRTAGIGIPNGHLTAGDRLRFEAQGTTFRVFWNDQKLWEGQAPSIMPTGGGGLKAGFNEDSFTVTTIDNFSCGGWIGQSVQSASDERQVPIAFDDSANLYVENPVGSRVLNTVTGPLVTLTAEAAMQVVSAYNKGYLAFSDLKKALGQAAVYNPVTGKLDPLSMRLVGDLWKAGETYQVGECICPAAPVGGNGHMYRCTVAGISGQVQPLFPLAVGGTVVDGTVTWQEMTPTMSKSAQLGNVPYGLRYMVTLFVNRNGYISGMTQSSVVEVDIPSPASTTTGYNTNVVSLVGNVTCYYWGDSPHVGPVGQYIWKKPGDAGTGTERTLASAVGQKIGSSLLFDLAPGAQETAVSWAQFDTSGQMTGTQDVFSEKLENEGFSDFNMVIVGSLYVPAAGTYTFQCKHKDGLMWGIGGDATWAGKGTVTGFSGQTKTVAGGYALLPSVTPAGGAGETSTENVDVTFPLPGIYPIELNWDYWYHSGRTLSVTCAPQGSPQANIMPVSLSTTTLNSSQYQMQVDHIPTGPENTVARICAFTQAGSSDSSAGNSITNNGPYFWIPPAAQYFTKVSDLSMVPGGVTVADVINGVTMNSTLINDNVTTSATFNFTDDYLRSPAYEVSSYFRKIQVPKLVDAYFAKSIGRMFYAVDSLQSGWYVSLVDDPESVLGDTGIVQVAENNSENRTAVRELSGVIYVMKERSGYVLEPTPEDPSKWRARGQWEGSGPCGPRAVDVCTEFMCYVHRSGVYIFKGGQPERISKEIPLTWKTINWKYGHTIWVKIDDDTKEIHIGVPTADSTTPDKILRLNYEQCDDNFRSPLGVGRDGGVIAISDGYKWSVDDIPANLAIRAQRPLVKPPDGLDKTTRETQFLYASSIEGGKVMATVPDVYNDDGDGIDWIYETASPPKVQLPCLLGGVKAYVDGKGPIWFEVLRLHAAANKKAQPQDAKLISGGESVIALRKPCTAGIPFYHGATGVNECFRVRMSNHKQPDVWASVKSVTIFARPIASAR